MKVRSDIRNIALSDIRNIMWLAAIDSPHSSNADTHFARQVSLLPNEYLQDLHWHALELKLCGCQTVQQVPCKYQS